MPPTPTDQIVILLTGVVIAAAIVGAVVPVIPGLVMAWAATVVFAFVTGFDTIAVVALAAITALTAFNYVVMVRIPQKTTLASGASNWSLAWGGLGAVIGFFAIPVVGLIVGGVVGVYLAERIRSGERQQAWAATKAALVGFGMSTLVQVGIGLAVGAVWLAWVVLRFDF